MKRPHGRDGPHLPSTLPAQPQNLPNFLAQACKLSELLTLVTALWPRLCLQRRRWRPDIGLLQPDEQYQGRDGYI